MLHVLNGDATLRVFATADMEGEAAVFADALHEGPLPEDPTSPDFIEARIRHAVEAGWAAPDRAAAEYARWTRCLGSTTAQDEVVLWLEADLFDQLLLVHHIEWLARSGQLPAGPGGPVVSLICVGDFEGVPDFEGFGQLTGEQLASLLRSRTPIGEAEIRLARDVWRAITSDDPREIEKFVQDAAAPLPFLGPALRRLLEEFPDRRSGLSRTERQALEAVAAGAATPKGAFRACTAMEERVFLGDLIFFGTLRKLATAEPAALDMKAEATDAGLPDGTLELTTFGRELLAGESDWVRTIGIDRCVGGVHLRGRDVRWRWDADAGRIHEEKDVAAA